MAYSPAPASPVAGGAAHPFPSSGLNSRTAAHAQSPSPPPANAPISKRDKRRSALQERLQDLTASFSQNRDAQFRQQLHALQCDMTLINNADPYTPGPLPDSADEVAQLIENTVGGGLFGREMASLSGMWYSRFVQEINQIKEDKDAELAMLMHRHESSLDRFQREYTFRNHFAAEEYNNLSMTLRERLVQTITGKKNRLMRDKEQLDIADTNSLLLHPNQFSITNPASPGGIHGNRKTRHTRRMDLDELNGIGSRKRKAPEEDVGSPVREGGTPADRGKTSAPQHQPSPTFSLHSLFTDKELSAHANHAHIATVHFFSTSKRTDQPGPGTSNNTDADDASGTADHTGQEDNGTPAATDMARTASQNFHATRSTRTHGSNALNALAELSDKQAVRPSLPYQLLANHQPRGNANAPPPPPLMNEEMEDDCARMERLQSTKPAGWVDRNLIEVLVKPGPEQVDGIPQDPHWFSMLHPDFPATLGVHWYPARNDRERPEMLGGAGQGHGQGPERKKTKT